MYVFYTASSLGTALTTSPTVFPTGIAAAETIEGTHLGHFSAHLARASSHPAFPSPLAPVPHHTYLNTKDTLPLSSVFTYTLSLPWLSAHPLDLPCICDLILNRAFLFCLQHQPCISVARFLVKPSLLFHIHTLENEVIVVSIILILPYSEVCDRRISTPTATCSLLDFHSAPSTEPWRPNQQIAPIGARPRASTSRP